MRKKGEFSNPDRAVLLTQCIVYIIVTSLTITSIVRYYQGSKTRLFSAKIPEVTMCRQDTRRRRANLIKIKNRACLPISADTFLFSVDGLEKSYSQKTLGASIAGSTIADHDNVTAGLHLLMGFNRINVPGVSEIKDKS